MNTNPTPNESFDEGFFPKAHAKNKSIINLNYLKEISGGNMSFIKAVLQAFKDESCSFIRDLETQLVVSDFLSMARTAHKLKPAGVYIGVNSFSVLIGNLEQAARNANEQEAVSLFDQAKRMIIIILTEIDLYLR